MMNREVLSLQGLVHVIDVQGRRRVLQRGDRLHPGDRLELADGAELRLRHADGHEEILLGERALPAARLNLMEPDSLSAPMPVKRLERSVPLARNLKLIQSAQPEAGLASEEPAADGHGFVRIEREQFSVPRSMIERVPNLFFARSVPTNEHHPSEPIEPIPRVALTARPPLRAPLMPQNEVADAANTPVLILRADLFEGAGFDAPSAPHTEVVIQQFTTRSPLLNASGSVLLTSHTYAHQPHSLLTVELLKTEAQAQGTVYTYEAIQQTLGEQMPNIPYKQRIEEHWLLKTLDGDPIHFINQITGTVDGVLDSNIQLIEAQDALIEPLDMAEDPTASPLDLHHCSAVDLLRADPMLKRLPGDTPTDALALIDCYQTLENYMST